MSFRSAFSHKTVNVVTALVGLSVGLVCATTAQAATITWNIQFFDETGVSIGDGSFSYDDSAPLDVTVPLDVDIPEARSVSIDSSEGWFGLTGFSATIDTLAWNLGDANPLYTAATAWNIPSSDTFSGGAEGPRRVSRDLRFGLIEKRNSWLFGEPRVKTPALFMFGDGSFSSSYGNEFGGSIELFRGSWTAVKQDEPIASVPEPGTILGTVVLSLSAIAGRKRISRGRNDRAFSLNVSK